MVRGCRRSFYVVFWRSRSLNCRTVVMWILLRATLVVKSQGRLARLPSTFAIVTFWRSSRWFVGVDIHFTSCSGGRGVSTVGLSSSGSFHCIKSIELFQIWSSPGPAGRLMSSKLDFGGLPKPIQFLICSLYRLLTFWPPTAPGALWEAFRPGCDV